MADIGAMQTAPLETALWIGALAAACWGTPAYMTPEHINLAVQLLTLERPLAKA